MRTVIVSRFLWQIFPAESSKQITKNANFSTRRSRKVENLICPRLNKWLLYNDFTPKVLPKKQNTKKKMDKKKTRKKLNKRSKSTGKKTNQKKWQRTLLLSAQTNKRGKVHDSSYLEKQMEDKTKTKYVKDKELRNKNKTIYNTMK